MREGITIGIIGGTGSMGQWFRKFFSDAGHTVLVSGRKTELAPADIAKQCEVVILSLPLDIAIAVTGKIGPLLSDTQLLMDFCSLKEKISEKMLGDTSAEVIGTHPLFGPFTDSIKSQNVILCPGRGDRWLKWIESEYISQGANVTIMDPSVHDRHMAVVQALTHFLTICMGRTLQKMNMDSGSAFSCSTPVFRINYDLIGRLFAQDLGLYRSIINNNRYFDDVFEIFLSSIHEGKSALSSDIDESGSGYLEDIREFFKDSCKEALRESNKIISALYL